MVVEELPKTRSGKIMRRLLRDVAEGRTVGDTTIVGGGILGPGNSIGRLTVAGDLDFEVYGLAWSGTAVPEPPSDITLT